MITKAIKMNNGLFIPHIGAFDDIKKDVIELEIEITAKESSKLDYKELRGFAIMERYYVKEERAIPNEVLSGSSILLNDEKIKSVDDLLTAINNGDF